MYTEIEKWCASCVDCAPLQPIPVDRPFDRVAVDVLGPLPTSERGNKCVVVFTDYFTK